MAASTALARPSTKYWPLDPLYSTPVVILAEHLSALPDAEDSPDVCWLINHPVRFVDVAGLIVSLDPKTPLVADSRVSFTLDDGTGFVHCVQWKDENDDESWKRALAAYRHGRYMHVHGRLGRYRQTRQVVVQRAWIEEDPQVESLRWLRAAELWHEVYTRPFRIPGHVLEAEQHEVERASAAGERQQPAPHSGARSSTGGAPHVSVEGLEQSILAVLQASSTGAGLNANELVRALKQVPGSVLQAAPQRAAVERVKEALRVLDDQAAIYMSGDAGREPRYRALS